jgi:hypothetical protein
MKNIKKIVSVLFSAVLLFSVVTVGNALIRKNKRKTRANQRENSL